ncbi:MAG: hypothetical protein VB138_15355, partial [Burkholderia sp.]
SATRTLFWIAGEINASVRSVFQRPASNGTSQYSQLTVGSKVVGADYEFGQPVLFYESPGHSGGAVNWEFRVIRDHVPYEDSFDVLASLRDETGSGYARHFVVGCING